MPGGDGTGPAGFGAMTGRAAGYCAGYGMPGFANPIPGRGWGAYGRGFGNWGAGRGRRNRFYATGVPGWAWFGGAPYGYGAQQFAPGAQFSPAAQFGAQSELDYLKGQAEYLEDALDGIKNRIAELEKQQAEEP